MRVLLSIFCMINSANAGISQDFSRNADQPLCTSVLYMWIPFAYPLVPMLSESSIWIDANSVGSSCKYHRTVAIVLSLH